MLFWAETKSVAAAVDMVGAPVCSCTDMGVVLMLSRMALAIGLLVQPVTHALRISSCSNVSVLAIVIFCTPYI